MKLYFKILIICIITSISISAKSQYVLCCKAEKVKYDLALDEYIVLSTTADYDSVVIDKFHIQIKQRKIYLTKRRELSKWSDKDGITTIYETISSDSKIVTVHVIETLNGITKLVIMDTSNLDYGTAYDLMGFEDRKLLN